MDYELGSVFSSLNYIDAKIVDNWWSAIDMCAYGQFDFCKIDL